MSLPTLWQSISHLHLISTRLVNSTKWSFVIDAVIWSVWGRSAPYIWRREGTWSRGGSWRSIASASQKHCHYCLCGRLYLPTRRLCQVYTQVAKFECAGGVSRVARRRISSENNECGWSWLLWRAPQLFQRAIETQFGSNACQRGQSEVLLYWFTASFGFPVGQICWTSFSHSRRFSRVIRDGRLQLDVQI